MNYSIKDDPLLAPATQIKEITLADTAPAIGIRRVQGQNDSAPSATGSIAVAAGTITFYSTDDATTAEGGADADNFPNETGLAAGVLDLSAFGDTPALWHEVVTLINAQPNWEAWLIGAVPDEAALDDLIVAAVAATTGGIISNEGYEIVWDTTLALQHPIAITQNSSSRVNSGRHGGDLGYNHDLFAMRVTLTGTGAPIQVQYIVCDDLRGTSETPVTLVVGLTTAVQDLTLWTNFIAAKSSIKSVEGKRLVVRGSCDTTLTAATISIQYQTRRVSSGLGQFYESDSA